MTELQTTTSSTGNRFSYKGIREVIKNTFKGTAAHKITKLSGSPAYCTSDTSKRLRGHYRKKEKE